MPLVLADRVKETTTTTGTGTITLDGASTGFQSFSVIGNGNTTYYTIAGQGTSEWEVGIGTYTTSGTTLSRDTVLASSAGAPTKTTFSAGTKDVFVTYPAGRSVYVDGSTLDAAGIGASAGQLLYGSATDTFALLAAGSSGQVLTSGGAGAPSWTSQSSLSVGTAANVAGLVANTFTTYGNTATTTTKNTYYGVLLGNATTHLNVMADTGGNGGFYRESNSAWPFYYNAGNNASGIGSTSTTSGYALTVTNRARIGPYAGSQVGNTSALEIFNNGGTGDSNLANITFHCTASYGASLHLRADGYMGMGGWSASAWRWYTYLVNGDMTASGNVTAYSDPRLKEDITLIQSALEKIKKLDGVKFKWVESSIIGHAGEYDYGVLATQVAAVAPELVADSMHEAPEGDRYKTVAYDKLAPFLIEAVKELAERLEALERGK